MNTPSDFYYLVYLRKGIIEEKIKRGDVFWDISEEILLGGYIQNYEIVV